MNSKITASLKATPKAPGVYWFTDRSGQVLYVGKAKNLKARLSSYRHLTAADAKTRQMLAAAQTVKWKAADSEFEALLVEAELVKLHQPRFNVLLKDDKSPLYIVITKDVYPAVLTARKNQIRNSKLEIRNCYGPYPSGYKAGQVLRFVRRIFPFCNQAQPPAKNKHACFYFHLGLCPGACCGKISPNDYQKNLVNLKLFLRGKKARVITRLKKRMRLLSASEKFEAAAKVRDQIELLENLRRLPARPELELPRLIEDTTKEKLLELRRILRRYQNLPSTYPLNRIEAYDISNISGKDATGSMVVFVKGLPQPNLYRHFKIKTLATPNDPQMLKEILSRRAKHSDWPAPDLIVIDGGKTQLKSALKVVPWSTPVIAIVKHPDRLLIPSRDHATFHQAEIGRANQALKLIQHLRNESHRFARRLHHHLRLKHLRDQIL